MTPADVNALGALVPAAPAPTMPPDPAEEQFLATGAAVAAGYAAAMPALEAQVAEVDADSMVLTYGDWARETSDLIATLRDLNAQVRALPVPPRYAPGWAEMLRAADLLDVALADLDEAISLYKLEKLAEYKEHLAAAKIVLAAAVSQIAPLPVVVVNVVTPVAALPLATTDVAGAVCPDAAVPTAVEKGGVIATPTVDVPTVAIPTVAVGIPLTVPTVAASGLASGGLGLTLDEWVAIHGQPDALVDGLHVFDEPEFTFSLSILNDRISTVYVAWKSDFRPTLAAAQSAASALIPQDAALMQASNPAADRFIRQYHSLYLATTYPDAPYAPQPVGAFTVTYLLAEDGSVFQMVLAVGMLSDS